MLKSLSNLANLSWNSVPLSERTMAGLPNRLIILFRKNSAIVLDSLFYIGWISMYLEKSSTQIIKYLYFYLGKIDFLF